MKRRASASSVALALLGLGSVVISAEPGWEKKIIDPGFRLPASQPGALEKAVAELFPEGEKNMGSTLERLREIAKPDTDHALECRILARLLRVLKHPRDEIQKADDLVLQAAPDLPEAWVNRAEFYATDDDPQKKGWAADLYLQAVRRVNLATTDWRAVLRADGGLSLGGLVKDGKFALCCEAVANALGNTPRGEAQAERSAALVLELLKERDALAQPAAVEKLLDVVAAAQPQIVLGATAGLLEAARAFDAAGHRDVARRIARLLALAPVPEEISREATATPQVFEQHWHAAHPVTLPPDDGSALSAARKEIALSENGAQFMQAKFLRTAWSGLQFFWEDSLPRYGPQCQARWILTTSLGDDADGFTTQALAAAKEQPWNESVITHALVAAALTSRLSEDLLPLASQLDAAARGRIALRISAIAAAAAFPQELLSPWLETGAEQMIERAKGKEADIATFGALLSGMDALERAGQTERLRRLLRASLDTPPRAVDTKHWERLFELFSRHGAKEDSDAFLMTWRVAVGRTPPERDHLCAIADAAVRAGPERGSGFAQEALAVWQRRYASESRRDAPETYAASRVAEALLTCGDGDMFEQFTSSLEKLTSPSSVFARMAQELRQLRMMLEGNRGRAPEVDAWVQAPEAPGRPAHIHWRFVLPNFSFYPSPLRMAMNGASVSRGQAEAKVVEAWWTAGTPHPLLQRLAKKYDLEFSTGESPDHLVKVTETSAADPTGSVEIATLPASGFLRATLRGHGGGSGHDGEPRMFSLRPALMATGREPGAAGDFLIAKPDPARTPDSWTKHDEERWGRLLAAPVLVDKNAEYLLTEWKPDNLGPSSRARLILLDERMRPLGPVAVASAGIPAVGAQPATWTPHRGSTLRFRPSDWVAEDDLVRVRTKEDDDARPPPATPRYMALVTRDAADVVPPLLQLRPFREVRTGGEPAPDFNSKTPRMPELNDEYVATIGFRVRSWHITMGPERAIFTGKGALGGFDVGSIPWKQLVHAESDLILGNEWPMAFHANRALVVEPTWSGERKLGVRFIPFSAEGDKYEKCERRDIPLPFYNHGEISHWMDGALLMVSSRPGDDPPEPVAAWLDEDGNTTVVPLPRSPLKGSPGLEVAWWGPGTKLTLHEDGILFHMEHFNGLRLLSVEPGDPNQLPPGAEKRKKKHWFLEQPQVLVERNDSGQTLRRFHLKQPCEGTPMAFDNGSGPVFLFTTEHEVLRVNPPQRE